MAQPSCSYNAPRRALLASVWPLGMGAGTQVSPPPTPFWAPHPWGLSKPQQCLLAVIISSLWLTSGALNADSLLAKGLEFSLQALFWKGLVWGCWRGQR